MPGRRPLAPHLAEAEGRTPGAEHMGGGEARIAARARPPRAPRRPPEQRANKRRPEANDGTEVRGISGKSCKCELGKVFPDCSRGIGPQGDRVANDVSAFRTCMQQHYERRIAQLGGH